MAFTDSRRYDIFLSFSGGDTRRNFTSHLEDALRRNNVLVFKDDKELRRGSTIRKSLFEAIEDSRFALVVFSKNYASSAWCLDELVKICECSKERGLTVLPVFYDVRPEDVENQTGCYGAAFDEHDRVYPKEVVDRWKTKMRELSYTSGWDLQSRDEAEFIEDIVKDILLQLRTKFSHIFSTAQEGLFGIEPHLQKMFSYLAMGELTDVRMIGMSGMSGIGKTTIARVIYQTMLHQFDGSCFLENVRETCEKSGKAAGLVSLQQQLLSHTLIDTDLRVGDVYKGKIEISRRLPSRRVLIIIDDVTELDQLSCLAGTSSWFHPGSRIIITTTNERLLRLHGLEDHHIYRVEGLDEHGSSQLFCWKAFRRDCPPDDYLDLSKDMITYADGHPLALDVLGSLLFGKPVSIWRKTIIRLKEIPSEEILKKLQIGFEGLEDPEKKVFLDIACFFKGEKHDIVTRILEICGFHVDSGIEILMSRSLLSINSEGKLWMHDLIQKLGQEIVRRESKMEPGERSRLWLEKDIYHVLRKNSGTEKVEGIVLDLCLKDEGDLSANPLAQMKKLRLFKVQDLCLSQQPDYLSEELRYLEWCRYPFKYLPPIFQPDNLIELHMRHSGIEELWNWKNTKPLKNLKHIDLSHSPKLKRTPDLRGVPNLEALHLENCTSLYEVRESIGSSKKLVLLNLKDCKKLEVLPSSMGGLESLKTLILSGCWNLTELPKELGNITVLEELDLAESGTGRQTLSTGGSWPSLLFSWISTRRKVDHHPLALTLSALSSSLSKLNLRNCKLTEDAIPDMSRFPKLRVLDLSGNNFVCMPISFSQNSKLEDLLLANYKRLESLLDLPPSIAYLRMDGCTSLKKFPNPFEKRSSKSLCLSFINCSKLNGFQDAFAWLRIYLHFMLRNINRGISCPNSHFAMCMPGNEVPGWYNYRSVGSPLKIQLPPCWYSDNWLGFSLSAVFEVQDKSLSGVVHFSCDLHANMPNHRHLHLVDHGTRIPDDISIQSNQLWFNFIPRENMEAVESWKTCNELEAYMFFNTKQFRVKYAGFRIVYKQDVQKLIRIISSLESSSSDISSQTAVENDSCVNAAQPSESDRDSSSSSCSIHDFRSTSFPSNKRQHLFSDQSMQSKKQKL